MPKPSRRALILFIVVELVFLIVLLVVAVKKSDRSDPAPPTAIVMPHEQEIAQGFIKSELVPVGLPVRLKIPKINVNAALDHVGITPQGKMGVPKGPDSAAWYELGPRPGEKGSSVIDGHFGYKNHIPAVFDNLHTLQKGDSLYIEDEKGTTISFVVRESRTYDPNEDVPGVFISSDGKAHLNLITCQGVWSNTQKSYSARLVVFADKTSESEVLPNH